MTQEEKIKFCLKCRFKKFDVQRGLLCNLTNMPADFESQCPDFWDENKYSRNHSEILAVKGAHQKTIMVFSIIIAVELLLVASLFFTKSFSNLIIVGLLAVLLNTINFIAILAGKKWAKNLLTLIFSIVILGGLIVTIMGTFFINASPNLILKLIVAIILCSITVYYINFNKSFLRFFNFKK